MRPRIVLCHGCFDPLHIGHVLHLEAAKRFGEILIVAITDDDSVNKGPRRPVFHVEHRRAMLEALRCVDATMVVKDSLQALKEVVPSIFCKGMEYADKILPEDRAFCEENGIVILFTTESSWSSTDLLRYYESRSS